MAIVAAVLVRVLTEFVVDLWMCRGKAFCSNECRKGYIEEEIEVEEAEELMILDSALNL